MPDYRLEQDNLTVSYTLRLDESVLTMAEMWVHSYNKHVHQHECE